MKRPGDLVDPSVTPGCQNNSRGPQNWLVLGRYLVVPHYSDRLLSLLPSVIALYVLASAVHPFCCQAASVLTPSLFVSWFLPFLKFPKRENLIPKFLQSTYHQAFS